MAGKWTDAGEALVGGVLFVSTATANYFIGIYKNVSEPGEADTMAAITEPSSAGTGYGRKVLTRGNWAMTGSVATFGQQTFTASAASWGTIGGYFICSLVSGATCALMAVEQFSDGPYTINDGDSVKITPSITIG